jgi:hypothetical protein
MLFAALLMGPVLVNLFKEPDGPRPHEGHAGIICYECLGDYLHGRYLLQNIAEYVKGFSGIPFIDIYMVD